VELTQRLNDKKTELKENRTIMDRSQADHDKLRLEDVEYVDSLLARCAATHLLVVMKMRMKTVPKAMAAVKTKTGVKVKLSARKERTLNLS
jgi:hypothetical protein